MTNIMTQDHQQTLSELQQFIENAVPHPTSKEKIEQRAKLLVSAIDTQLQQGREKLNEAKKILETCKKTMSQFSDIWSAEEIEYQWIEQCFNDHKGYVKNEFTYSQLDPNAENYQHTYQSLQLLVKTALYFIKDTPDNFCNRLRQQRENCNKIEIGSKLLTQTKGIATFQNATHKNPTTDNATLIAEALEQVFGTSSSSPPLEEAPLFGACSSSPLLEGISLEEELLKDKSSTGSGPYN